MRSFLIVIALVGCGGDDAPPDSPPALDCTTYCSRIQTNCTSANAQYPNMDQCMATCASFAVGTSKVTDTAGNTLGCRINSAVAASTMAGTQCPHAGPAGDLITAAVPAACSGGDICMSFCTLEIMACGSLEAPLPGNPRDNTNNPLFQYQNMDDCMRLCPAWDKTHNYSTTSTGNSLACRLNAATSAAL